MKLWLVGRKTKDVLAPLVAEVAQADHWLRDTAAFEQASDAVSEGRDNCSWEFQGLFDTLDAAVAQCDDVCFVGPVIVNEVIPGEPVEWEGAFFPTLEPEKLAQAREAEAR